MKKRNIGLEILDGLRAIKSASGKTFEVNKTSVKKPVPYEFIYPFDLRPLTEKEGSGWAISFPDLPGCMSDGETIIEAMQNGQDAFVCWMSACKETGREIPLIDMSSESSFVTSNAIMILSFEEYCKLVQSHMGLVEFFQASPLVGLELDFARSKELPRK